MSEKTKIEEITEGTVAFQGSFRVSKEAYFKLMNETQEENRSRAAWIELLIERTYGNSKRVNN